MTEAPGQLDMLDPLTHARTTDADTSKAAAAALPTSRAGSMMRELLWVYRYAADLGLTAEQAAESAGYTPADGAWKRCSDLERAGLIEDTGERRTSSKGRAARVLCITLLGIEVTNHG